MATKTWQNGGVNNNYSTAGNWVEGSKPAAGDDVVIAANYAMTVDEGTAAVKSWDMTGYANTMSGSQNIAIQPGAATVNCIIRGASGYTGALLLQPRNASAVINADIGTYGGSITVGSTSSDVGIVNLTTNSTIPAGKTFTHSFGTLHIDGATDNSGLTHSWGAFSSSNSNTRVSYAGTSNITLTGTGSITVWDFSTVTGLTFNCGTSTITANGAGATGVFQGGGKTFNVLNITGSGSWTVRPATFATLNRTGTAAKTDTMGMSGTIVVTGTLTLAGNSATNRLLVQSTSLGTQQVFTVTGATANGGNNYDLKDIGFNNGGSNLDLTNGGTNLVGDCGGNGMSGGGTLTVTTGATQTLTMSTAKSWSDATIWSGRVPLPQDSIDASGWTGGTLTYDMPRACTNFDTSAASGRTMTTAISTGITVYGNIDFSGLSTLSGGSTDTWILEGRGNHTIKSNGRSFTSSITIQAFGGTYTLQDALSIGGSGSSVIGFLNGTFDAASYNVTSRVLMSSNTTNTRALKLGSGTWTSNSSNGSSTIWLVNATGMTLTPGTSTIVMGHATATAQAFQGGTGLAYNNLTFIAGTGTCTVTQSNTFNTFTINSPKTVTFTSGTTQTVSNFVATGTAGNLVTINSSSAGSAATLTAANTIPKNNDYMSITDINVTNGTFFYGGHSTYVSGTGWKRGNSADMFRSLY